MKAFAVQLMAVDTVLKTKEMKQVMDQTNAVGIHPDYPFAYIMWRTHKERMAGFKMLEKIFDHCKVVSNIAEIPD